MEPLSVLVTSVLSAGTVAWLAQLILTNRVKAAIENEYKLKEATFKAELDGKLEGVKTGYKILADEKHIVFSKMHEERAEVIRTFYEYLSNAGDNLDILAHPLKLGGFDEEKAIKRTRISLKKLHRYYSTKRIFFNNELVTAIDKLLEHAKVAYIDLVPMARLDDGQKYKRQRDAYALLQGDFANTKRMIETEFRIILGIVEVRS